MKHTTDQAESVSSLVDNELSGHELEHLMGCMKDDRELMGSWERYHLISDTLRKNLPSNVCPDFSLKISQAIESEPAILAPRRRHFKATPLFRQVAGLGLAASVTAVAIFATQGYFAAGGGQPAAVATVQPLPKASDFDRIQLPQQRKQVPVNIDKYLANHSEHASGGLRVIPYARIVGYSATDPKE